ncbi:MAG: hypothetical protein GW808_06105 [Sphingomonadales bacterium]|nr:hypothetical protein [Sphingomonadales bacterium]NCP00130.1 hypothetical protein [Sphingomonadales bacterium]NCP27914.1 hypothetical protein [Sphingomonadales bacterium]NCQ08753.1 hypothetical protein [Sphingomonadales bacterium]PIX66466.1 MAG: hypothetical protein COZ43_06540 [Sphingomonadales bacterium CG_4_10_14_3_um_filter_58_15]
MCLYAVPAQAQSAGPKAAPSEPVEILEIGFTDAGLSGAGGERLKAALADAQFVAVGEDHGFAGAPRLGQALAKEARVYGPLYHAVEVGPVTMQWVRARLASGGLDAIESGIAGKPLAFPFLSNREDAALADGFEHGNMVWGIDQEFVGAPMILMDELAVLAPDSATKARLLAIRDADIAALAKGDFENIWLNTADAVQFSELAQIFAESQPATAIIDALAASAQIYRLNNRGAYLQNNEERAALMRGYFLDQYRAAPAPAPRVLFKMGAYHMGRGTTPTSIYDLGSLLPGLAAANGLTSVHIVYLPLGGTVRVIKPADGKATAVQPYEDEGVGAILAAAEIIPERIGPTGHYLIPIAPLRHLLAGKKMNALPGFAKFVLLGFDYLVTTRDAKAATAFEATGK